MLVLFHRLALHRALVAMLGLGQQHPHQHHVRPVMLERSLMCPGPLFLVNATLAMLAHIHRLALHHALVAMLGLGQQHPHQHHQHHVRSVTLEPFP